MFLKQTFSDKPTIVQSQWIETFLTVLFVEFQFSIICARELKAYIFCTYICPLVCVMRASLIVHNTAIVIQARLAQILFSAICRHVMSFPALI